jgi:VIT family
VNLSRFRILSPLERFSEIVFGLIMVLTFTGALSVADVGRDEVRTMLLGAIGCNLAWGVIDAVFYLISCLTEHGRRNRILRTLRQCADATRARQVIARVLPEEVAAAMESADFEHIHAYLKQLPHPAERLRPTSRDYLGAIGVFLLVFLSTFPVVIPFIFIHDTRIALRISNGIAIALLFGSGYMVAAYAGLRPIRSGLIMVAIGVVLVALTIALGG